MTRKRLTKKVVKDMGFHESPYCTRGNSFLYDLKRNRILELSSVGTTEECLILQTSSEKDCEMTDKIVLHDQHKDGYLTKQKIKQLIKFFIKR